MKALRLNSRNALIFQHPNPLQIRTVIPDVHEFNYRGKNLLAVKHDIRNTKILSSLGYEANSPILYNYNWSGRYNPFSHQEQIAAFFTMHHRCFCLADIGTGKSLSALWAADYLMQQGLVKKVLVLSPLSTLDCVWGDEIFKHFPHRRYTVLHGTAAKRKQLLNTEADFYIINHDGFRVVTNELAKRDDFDLIILDESAVYRNSQNERYKVFANHIKNRNKTRLWMMTGTPTPNAPTDAWAQVKLVNPTAVPKYFSRFRDQVMFQQSQYKWVPRPNAVQQVMQIMQPSIRFHRDECLDLPETIYQERHIDLTKAQKDLYTELAKNLYVQYQNGEITAANEAVKLSKLIQVCCGVVYDNEGTHQQVDASPRLNQLLSELIEEAGEKVIVFAPLTGALHLIQKYLSKKWSCAFIDGSVSKNQRTQIFRSFQQSKDPHVLIAHPKTMSHGLTLTEASTIIWYAPFPSAEVYEQANGRITRSGQRHVTNIVHITSTNTEKRIYSRLKSNLKLQGLLMDAIKEMM